MVKHEKGMRGEARQPRASRTVRGEVARARGSVAAASGDIGLSGGALREMLARGDAREMRRVEARLRKWLKGTYELVDELEHVIVELEGPAR